MGKAAHPSSRWAEIATALWGPQPRYDIPPLTKLSQQASITHHLPVGLRAEPVDARQAPSTKAYLSEGPGTSPAPPPPPKWRPSPLSRRAGEELHFPAATAAPERCDWPEPAPNQRGGGGQRCRRCWPAEAGGRAAVEGGGTWRWVSAHRGGCCCCTCRPGAAASSSCCCSSSSSAASSGEDRKRRR